jgi:hypothetical protein
MEILITTTIRSQGTAAAIREEEDQMENCHRRAIPSTSTTTRRSRLIKRRSR